MTDKEFEMQIPKQPRTKSTTAEPESGSAGSQSNAPLTAAEMNKKLQEEYSSYVKGVNSAYLQAQLDQAKAYLDYLGTLHQHSPKSGTDPTLQYWREILQAEGDAQAATHAQKKFASASVDQHATYQKALVDATTAYSQSSQNIWDKLQSEVGQHNKEIADSLKDALLKVDVSTASIPALSLLYQGLRTMTPPSEPVKSE
jgi:hypothetical protein